MDLLDVILSIGIPEPELTVPVRSVDYHPAHDAGSIPDTLCMITINSSL